MRGSSSRASVSAAATIIALALTGCPGDPKTVDANVDAEAFSVASAFITAIEHESYAQACATLTFAARIELEARLQRLEGLRSRPTCERALAGRAFAARCTELWIKRKRAINVYRAQDVGERDATPKVAWTAVIGLNRRLTGHCEMRLTREGDDDSPWRIDAVVLENAHAVSISDASSLVYRDGADVKQP